MGFIYKAKDTMPWILCCDMSCGDLHAIKVPCLEYLCCDMSCRDLHALRYYAINTYALNYGALIYKLSFTCQRLLAAHSGTRDGKIHFDLPALDQHGIIPSDQ